MVAHFDRKRQHPDQRSGRIIVDQLGGSLAPIRGNQNALTISGRTKAALAAAKARGVKLGGPKLRLAQFNGAKSNKAQADRFAANVLPLIREAQNAGAFSLRAIALTLNSRGVPTARGGKWAAPQVRGILRRAN